MGGGRNWGQCQQGSQPGQAFRDRGEPPGKKKKMKKKKKKNGEDIFMRMTCARSSTNLAELRTTGKGRGYARFRGRLAQLLRRAPRLIDQPGGCGGD